MKYSKVNKIVKLCYIEIYNKSIPSANFIDLFNNAPTDFFGRKKIEFNKYEIKSTTFQEIVDKICKTYKATKAERNKVFVELYLGATPIIVEKTLYERRIEKINNIKNNIKTN